MPFAFLGPALVSVVFERALYRRLYGASDLDQVLLTIGLAFVSVAVAAYFYGTIQQPVLRTTVGGATQSGLNTTVLRSAENTGVAYFNSPTTILSFCTLPLP